MLRVLIFVFLFVIPTSCRRHVFPRGSFPFESAKAAVCARSVFPSQRTVLRESALTDGQIAVFSRLVESGRTKRAWYVCCSCFLFFPGGKNVGILSPLKKDDDIVFDMGKSFDAVERHSRAPHLLFTPTDQELARAFFDSVLATLDAGGDEALQ